MAPEQEEKGIIRILSEDLDVAAEEGQLFCDFVPAEGTDGETDLVGFFFLFFLFPVSVPGFTPSVLSSPEESSAMPEEPVPSSGRGE